MVERAPAPPLRHRRGADLRRPDRGGESFALAELIAACVAQSALDYDDGGLPAPLRQREIEENLWRAIRYGMDGKQIDFAARTEIEAREALERLLAWTGPARKAIGVGDPALPEENGAQRARGALADGVSIEQIYRDSLAETRRTYVPQGVPDGALGS